MNEQQSRDFFRPLGWELKYSDDPKLGRWLLEETATDRPASILGFDSLVSLWRWCKRYTELCVCQRSILDYLVSEFLTGDEDVRRFILRWVARREWLTTNANGTLDRIRGEVERIERNTLKTIKRWRRSTAIVLTNDEVQMPTLSEFGRLLNARIKIAKSA
jgi:hypothetical protein